MGHYADGPEAIPFQKVITRCPSLLSWVAGKIPSDGFDEAPTNSDDTKGVLTGDAWVSPGQWGEDAWLALIFIGAGLVVLQRVGRWDTAVAFLGTYALLEALRNLWLGWTWDVVGHRLRSGSLLLFALFMIPDPRSIPDACWGRRVWAGSVALLTFIFKNYYFISTAPFWALFLLAPVTVWIDRTWPAPRFQWRPHGPTPEAQPQGSGVRS